MTNEEFLKEITLEGEEWKGVPEYEQDYMCSNFGRVVRLRRLVRNGHGSFYKEPRLVKPTNNHSYNHLFLAIYIKGKRVAVRYIHRLVAQLFIDNPNNYNIVEHLDADATNNHYSNLAWSNVKINQNNPITKARISASNKGRKNEYQCKPVVQLKNREIIATFNSTCEAARSKHGYSQGDISAVCRGKAYSHKGYQWMFLSDYENLVNKSKNSSSPEDKQISD